MVTTFTSACNVFYLGMEKTADAQSPVVFLHISVKVFVQPHA